MTHEPTKFPLKTAEKTPSLITHERVMSKLRIAADTAAATVNR